MTAQRLLARTAAVVAAAGFAVLGLAGPAFAHVTVNPSEATQGGYAALTFRVPNEEAAASTTKLEVALPTDNPIASVSVKPVPGWKIETTTSKLAKPVTTDDGQLTEAVSRIVWTATSKDSQIAPGQFQEFSISVGPLPETDKVVFKALQTYSNGEVVRWIEEQTGSDEPKNPAPTLKLVKGTGDDDHHATSTDTSEAASASSTSDDDSGNGVAIGLGVAGLVAGVAGLIAGLLALRRSTAS
ncbi:YcnI family protein [Cryptosporangium phraense]|uniref:YcnI family protein n=1 Tax=Cryptosporangium phraense TaxID=2593070 RepID=A0A545AYJ3_9ACTN|nr:YcnI family protein [Cryptosporangium phraense]TQS45655.1 YcnI family protein [Cryptosporangium phraense]